MKLISFIIFAVLLFLSVFHVGGATIENESLILAVMMLLLSLFSDLKELDFLELKPFGGYAI